MMALAMTTTVFTSCEDVPAPYSVTFEENNNNNTNTPTTPTAGTGTEADPFNVAAALKYIDAGQNLDKEVYVSGTIVSVKEIDAANYGNATYLISDDGTTNGQLTVYRGYALGNKKFTASDKLNAGDKVVVYGKLVNFKGTKEFALGNYIYSLNGNKAAQPTPTADLNTEASAWTVTEAVQKIQANQTATGEAYVKGVISEVVSYNENYKSITYYISDNGTDKTLQVFSGKGLNGATTNKYMKASAFKKPTNYAAESRLTSPAFSLAGKTTATLSFKHAAKFFANAANEFKVQVSTDGTTWHDVAVSAYPTGADWNFIDATCNLSAYAGKATVYIGFLYTSTAAKAGTWEIKDVEVK